MSKLLRNRVVEKWSEVMLMAVRWCLHVVELEHVGRFEGAQDAHFNVVYG